MQRSSKWISLYLVRRKIFEILKEDKENLCFRCKNEVKEYEDMSIEHKIPWSDGKTQEEKESLFYDPLNLSISHKTCNYQFGCGRENQCGYKGVKRGSKNFHARFTASNGGKIKEIGFGAYSSPFEASIARDIGCFLLKDDHSLLNHPEIKEDLKDLLLSMGNIEVKPHKSDINFSTLVNIFKEKLNDK